MFSKSGRVTSWTRSRLTAAIITETMRYKDYLSYVGKPLDPKVKNWVTKAVDKNGETDEEMEETEEERVALIKWEKQWWQRVDARMLSLLRCSIHLNFHCTFCILDLLRASTSRSEHLMVLLGSARAHDMIRSGAISVL